jgi:membrane protein DedA with SNARE-associated domain
MGFCVPLRGRRGYLRLLWSEVSLRSLLLRHGYAFLLCYIFCVQAGAPVPADPLLLIMGALVGDGRYSLVLSIAVGAAAAVAGDLLWYELGRRKGAAVLGLLCRLSLEPDSCVRKAETGFARRGAWSLVFSKFVPGLSLVSVPVAGAIRMRPWKFLAADGAGSLLWCAASVALGRIFHRQVEAIIALLGLFGRRAGFTVALLITGYIGFRYLQRWLFIRRLRVNRISPAEAFGLVESGSAVTIVDLRHAAEIERNGFKIAGARILTPDEIRSRSHEIPAGQEIILYCT